MATAEEGEAEQTEVTQVGPDTLLPVRLKSRGQPVIGNEEQALTRDSGGFTKAIVYATAESILKCPVMQTPDLAIVAQDVDEDLLEFESYTEEVNSRYGRAPLKIVLEEGLEAYEEIQGQFNNNAYLHAALHDMTVMEAAEELDTNPQMVVKTEDGFSKYSSGYGSPTLVSAATIDDEGVVRDMDLREFKPDLEWVVENWTTTGGNRRHTRHITNHDEEVAQLRQLAVNEVEGTLRDSVVNKSSKSRHSKTFTIHFVRDVEESIVEDEEDRLVAYCGSGFDLTDSLTRLTVDDGRVDSRIPCGSCTNIAE